MADQQNASLPAGSIVIDKCELKSLINGKTIDITGIIMEFAVQDSMERTFITANFLINDALALITQFPIVGQETIELSFKTPHPAFKKSIQTKWNVIGIEKMRRSTARSAQYLLKCVPLEYVKDLRTKIRKSYGDMPIHEMVGKVFETFLQNDTELVTKKESEGIRTIVIPNMCPSDAIKFLASQAKSTSYPTSNFAFWQNFDGFHFSTIDEILQPQQRGTSSIDKYYTTEFNVGKDDLSPRDVAGGGGGASQNSTKPFEFLKILHFDFIHLGQYDKITRLGGLESRMGIIDPALMLWETKDYNYFADYDKFKRTYSSQPEKFLTPDAEYLNSGETKTIFRYTDRDQTNNYAADQSTEFLQYEIASKAMLENIMVNIVVPGDSTRRSGETVRLEFPEYGATDDVLPEVNKFVSGEYLIVATKHAYTDSGYKTAMLCVKNAFEEAIEGGVQPNQPTTP